MHRHVYMLLICVNWQHKALQVNASLAAQSIAGECFTGSTKHWWMHHWQHKALVYASLLAKSIGECFTGSTKHWWMLHWQHKTLVNASLAAQSICECFSGSTKHLWMLHWQHKALVNASLAAQSICECFSGSTKHWWMLLWQHKAFVNASEGRTGYTPIIVSRVYEIEDLKYTHVALLRQWSSGMGSHLPQSLCIQRTLGWNVLSRLLHFIHTCNKLTAYLFSAQLMTEQMSGAVKRSSVIVTENWHHWNSTS